MLFPFKTLKGFLAFLLSWKEEFGQNSEATVNILYRSYSVKQTPKGLYSMSKP